ncbi:MAG TPA: alpha/beta hydrolase [Flavobacteriales bacterium]|nr:alpha/beta hydrolase [Flavobacteriales bacterium]
MKENAIHIPLGKITLAANLYIPEEATSLIIFSHGSGSSRLSPRNTYVARFLQKQLAATLLVDLLTEQEDQLYANRFNIALLTQRLVSITQHMHAQDQLKHLPIGYFGASTGAASALNAATQLPELIFAVVSRGGRPDMAAALSKVQSPTLLIVGSLDTDVITLNQQAYSLLRCDKKLEIVEGASHLFEEPGKLNEVVALASAWFSKQLTKKNKSHVIH